MASITSRPNGGKVIEFVDGDGRRRSVFLPKTTQRVAVAVKTHIERLESAKRSGGPIDSQTASWLSEIGGSLKAKLAKVGLIAPSGSGLTVAAFVDQYIQRRTDIKPRTHDMLTRARRSLIGYLGESKRLQDVTEGDAKDFRIWLAREGGTGGTTLQRNTVNDRCRKAKQFFASAVEHRLIDRNPFAVLKGISVRANPERFVYVTADAVRRVIEAAGDHDLSLVLALCRFGGLRNPSETLNLRWENVDLPAGRMSIDSPKTEHHDGKAYRVAPIFGDLRPFLEAAWDRAKPGAVFVVASWRDQGKNMRTRLARAIRRAGLQPWGKPFQNLRSSCQTDLEEQFPSHVVCSWLGNSERVAREHYLQVTDEHFARAAASSSGQRSEYPANPTGIEAHGGIERTNNSAQFPLIRHKSRQIQKISYTPQGSNDSTEGDQPPGLA